MNQEEERLLKEAAFKFKEAKRLEFQLYKKLQEGYTLVMKVIYPNYKTPKEMRSIRGGRLGNVGDMNENTKRLGSDEVFQKAGRTG